MKYFLIAGEPSGDQHGSMLMKSILAIDPYAEFRFLGGDLMERVGGVPVIHIRYMAFMGFTQLLSKLFRIRENFRICKREIIRFQPHLVIPIDYGGFNLRMIRWLKSKNIKSVYYITPKVWAWMPSRAFKLARYTVHALCILPFEPGFLRNFGVQADYVGNPVCDYVRLKMKSEGSVIAVETGLTGKPVIALLPGSRHQEISRILPVMVKVARQFNDYQFIIAGHENFQESFYRELCGPSDFTIVYGKTLDLLKTATAALVTSGTATLETALFGIPQVVCYRSAPISYLIARMMIRIKFISLVNLILGKPCVEELIQSGFNAGNLRKSLERILPGGESRQKIIEGYRELQQILGDNEASVTAAGFVCRIARES